MDEKLKKEQEEIEARQARIRNIVEGGHWRCPSCGFMKYKGAIHPYAGRYHYDGDLIRWCDGKGAFYKKRAEG